MPIRLTADSESQRTFKLLNLIATAAVFMVATSCGIPNYAAIEPPIRMETIHPNDNSNQPQLPSHVIAFRTPAESGSTIVGYAIYYKIYRDPTDFDAEDDETKWFDPNSPVYAVQEMQPGTIVPNKRGFFRLGTGIRDPGTPNVPASYKGVGSLSDVNTHYIGHPGPNQPIYIDFDPTGSGDKAHNKREKPIIGFKYPMYSNGSFDFARVVFRGFIDPDPSKKNDGFRSFVGDWNFQDQSNSYTDGDLRRKGWTKNQTTRPTEYNVLQYQPGSTKDDVKKVGNPLFTDKNYTSFLKIGFVAHSYGIDVSGGDLKPVTSIPVYIGDIEYQGYKDTNR